VLVAGWTSVAPQLMQKTASEGAASLQFGQPEDSETIPTIRKQVYIDALHRTPHVKLVPDDERVQNAQRVCLTP